MLSFSHSLHVLLLFSFLFLPSSASRLVGVSFRADNDLVIRGPTPDILKEMAVPRLRIINPDGDTISSLAGMRTVVNLAIEEEHTIKSIAINQTEACHFVRSMFAASGHRLKISSFTIGHNVFLGSPHLTETLMKAIQNVRHSLDGLGLPGVGVTTANDYKDVMDGIFPPSASKFNQGILPQLLRLLDFLNKTKSPFQIDMYPYEVFKANAVAGADLKYAMFEVDLNDENILIDNTTWLRYGSIFDMMRDSTISALQKVGHGNMPLEITATGWPNKSPVSRYSALENDLISGEYNQRVINLVNSRKGTPLRPNQSTPVYINGLVNDDTSGFDDDSDGGIGFTCFMGIMTDNMVKRYTIDWGSPPPRSAGAVTATVGFFYMFLFSSSFFFLLLLLL